MKQVLTHTSRSIADVIELLKTGSFCCPRLPHYRYRQTQQAAAALNRAGMLKFTGKTDTGTNYIASDRFKEWKAEFEGGHTTLQPIKWDKIKKRELKEDQSHE